MEEASLMRGGSTLSGSEFSVLDPYPAALSTRTNSRIHAG